MAFREAKIGRSRAQTSHAFTPPPHPPPHAKVFGVGFWWWGGAGDGVMRDELRADLSETYAVYVKIMQIIDFGACVAL